MLSVSKLFIIITGVVAAFNLELLIFLRAFRFGHFHIM